MSNSIRVLKFGGTSVGTPEGLQQLLQIVEQPATYHRWVVLSACAGITDLLDQLAHQAASGIQSRWQGILQHIRQQHYQLIAQTFAETEIPEIWAALHPWFAQLERLAQGVAYLEELTERQRASFLAYGELLSSTMVATALQLRGVPAIWFDIRHLLRTKEERWIAAPIDWAHTQQQLASLHRRLAQDTPGIWITQGYIAQNVHGQTTVFDRGGSDYSAALLGALLEAERIEIWTDVPGILTADPQLLSDAHPIPKLSFSQMRQLALLGAKVLHPNTLLPAEQARIPVHIRSTFEPTKAGTVIDAATVWDTVELLALVLQPQRSIRFIDTADALPSNCWIVQQYPDGYLAVGESNVLSDTHCDVIGCLATAFSPQLLVHILEALRHIPLHFLQMNSSSKSCLLGVPAGQGQEAMERLHPLCLRSRKQPQGISR